MRRPETDKMSSHVVSGTLVAYEGYTDRLPPNLKNRATVKVSKIRFLLKVAKKISKQNVLNKTFRKLIVNL